MLDFAIALSGLLVGAGEVFEDDRHAGRVLGLLIATQGSFPGLNGAGVIARSILLNAVLDLLFGALGGSGKRDRGGGGDEAAQQNCSGMMRPRPHRSKV